MGAETPELLLSKAVEVFRRFDEFGVKVNFDKVKWLTSSISFLGYEIRDGRMSLESFLQKKQRDVGFVSNIKGLERVIGILSYARRVIKKSEEVLAPLRKDLKKMKREMVTLEWLGGLNDRVKEAFAQALHNIEWLTLPGNEAKEFILDIDWSGDYSGYMLFAKCLDDEKHLVDIGSKVGMKAASSYLGELDTIVWACRKTKAFRGSILLLIRFDNHGVVNKSKAYNVHNNDIRSFRRWF